jgi:hypothetical protein
MRWYQEVAPVREAINVRFPAELMARLRAESEARRESVNQIVVAAVEAELRRSQAERALQDILELGARLQDRARSTGRWAPDSTDMIRDLREGTDRRA